MLGCRSLDPVSEIEIEVFQELIDLNHSFIVSLCRLHHEHTIVTYSALAVLEMKIWIYWSKSHYLIYFYILLNKNWIFYWSEQSCTGLWPEDPCLLWGLTSICAVKLHGLNNFLLYMVFVQDIVFSGNWLVRDCNSFMCGRVRGHHWQWLQFLLFWQFRSCFRLFETIDIHCL